MGHSLGDRKAGLLADAFGQAIGNSGAGRQKASCPLPRYWHRPGSRACDSALQWRSGMEAANTNSVTR